MIHYTAESIKFSPYTAIIANPNDLEHYQDFWKIMYTLNGTCRQKTNGVIRTVSTNTILIAKPYDILRNMSYSKHDYRHRDIYISDDNMKKLCAMLPNNPYESLVANCAFFTVDIINIEYLENILNEFPVNSMETNDYLSTLHNTVVLNVLTWYIKNKNETTKAPNWIANLADKINNSDFLKNNVSYMLSDVPYSHGHICREFKKFYGITLSEYLTKAKIVYASTLLCNKDLSIISIAFELGFSTQSSFIKSFKRYYNMSPGAYRTKYLKDKTMRITSHWGPSDKVPNDSQTQ